jgi:hypothetical protein
VTDQPNTQELPFVFFGQRVLETTLALSGTISHPEAQPPKAYTVAGERVVFVVVAYTDGQATKPLEGPRTLQWANKLKLAEAYELDAEKADPIVDQLREEVRKELGQLPTGDDPKHGGKARTA